MKHSCHSVMANISDSGGPAGLFTTLNGHSVTTSSLVLDIFLSIFGLSILSLNGLVLDVLVKRDPEATELLMCFLAATDMMTGVLVLHNVIYRIVHYLDAAECLIRLGATIMFVSSSVYHLTLLTLDRFVKIVFPYRYPKIITKLSVSIMSSAVWIFSINLGLLPVYGWNRIPLSGEPPCSLLTVMTKEYTIMALSVFFFPTVVIGMMYYKIFLVARRHARAIADADISARTDSSNMKFAKAVLILIGSYSVTMFPLALVVTIYVCGGFDETATVTVHNYTVYTSVFTYSNSLVNPITYAFKVPQVKSRIRAVFRKRDTKRDT